MALYRGMDQAALDAAYNNRAAVPHHSQIFTAWQLREAMVRDQCPPRPIPYGSHPRQVVDWYSGKPGAPVLAFIHGGYWQGGDRQSFCFIAEGALSLGWHVAMIGYRLAPEVRMPALVEDIRLAMTHLLAACEAMGGDPNAVALAGHSAGGHLAALCLDMDISLGVPISGLFDLEPISLSYLDEALHLTDDDVQRYSPQRRSLAGSPPLLITVGGQELPELVRHSRDFLVHAQDDRVPATWVEAPDRDHFTILEDLANPEGRLLARIAETLS